MSLGTLVFPPVHRYNGLLHGFGDTNVEDGASRRRRFLSSVLAERNADRDKDNVLQPCQAVNEFESNCNMVPVAILVAFSTECSASVHKPT